MSHNPALAYRPDIDGLRAIAVLAVVFYHFGIGGISGGFVGVDIFFVISGFLITGIIQREIEQDRFTFTGFYERRIRRIFPALFVVLAATLIAGSIILLPSDLILLSKSTIATLLFSSNIFFWRNSGYFDANSELNPLLHTWSLAVEEQFYIGLPILLILIYKYARNWLKPVLILFTVVSLAGCLWQQVHRPTATFYLSPFRAWELLLGSYLAVGNLPKITKLWVQEILALLGLILILVSIVFIKADINFPGWRATVPVLGTCLLIYTGSLGKNKIASILSTKPFVFIGLISYSLYLWHWPILVFANYVNGLEPLGNWAWVGIVLSLFLAVISYYWVETPLRIKKQVFSKAKLFNYAAILTIFTFSVSLIIYSNSGFPSRFTKELLSMDSERNQPNSYKMCDIGGNPVAELTLNIECQLGDKTVMPSVILWGDSHAMSIAPAFDKILEENKFSGIILGNSSCVGLIDVNIFDDPWCRSSNDNVMNFIVNNKNIKTVVLHSLWGGYTGKNAWKVSDKNGHEGIQVFNIALVSTIAKLNELGKKVIVVGPVPLSSTTPDKIAIRKRFDLVSEPILYSKYLENNKDFFASLSGINPKNSFTYIDISTAFCTKLVCNHMMNSKNMYRDGHHLTLIGAQYLIPILKKNLSTAQVIE